MRKRQKSVVFSTDTKLAKHTSQSSAWQVLCLPWKTSGVSAPFLRRLKREVTSTGSAFMPRCAHHEVRKDGLALPSCRHFLLRQKSLS
jgi:hypothetical protein